MHPTLAIGLVILTWLLVHNRSTVSRVLLGITALLLGWEPASAGSRVGYVLLLVAAGVAASLLWDRLRKPIDRGDQDPPQVLSQLPPDDAPDQLLIHRPAAASASSPSPLPSSPSLLDSLPEQLDEPLTELDRADAYGNLLDANIEGLHEAQESGDVRAQAAFAGEIAELAKDMRSLLRVVVGERRRLRS